MLTIQQRNKEIEKYKKLCIKQEIDIQKIDWASWAGDNSLYDYLKNEYSLCLKALPEQIKNSQSEHEKAQLEEFNRNEKEVIAYNNRKIESVNVEDFFKPIKRVISKMVMGYANFVIIKGRAGLGKSYNIERYLKELKVDYREITHITEAYLYRVLYENKDKIIWFKDFSALLRSLRGIEELKAATETKEERLITNYNYSDYQEDIPKDFIFKGKILIDCNNIEPKFREDMDALISRAGNNYIDFAMDFETIKELMLNLADTPQKKEVTQFLIDCYEFVGFNELNLRIQQHCFKTYEFAAANGLDWKEELKQELKNNKSRIRSIVYNITGNKAIKSTELKKYLIRSGYCSTLRTAARRLQEWIEIEEVFKVSTDEYNYFVSLNPINWDKWDRYNDKIGGGLNGNNTKNSE